MAGSAAPAPPARHTGRGQEPGRARLSPSTRHVFFPLFSQAGAPAASSAEPYHPSTTIQDSIHEKLAPRRSWRRGERPAGPVKAAAGRVDRKVMGMKLPASSSITSASRKSVAPGSSASNNLAQPSSNRVPKLARRGVSSQVGCSCLSSGQHILDSPHQGCGGLLLSQKVQKHLARPDGGDRIGGAFACNVGRRAMYGLKET